MTSGPWTGPIAHGDRKLPSLTRMSNRFVGRGRSLALTTRISPLAPPSTSPATEAEVVAAAIAVSGETHDARLRPGEGWEPSGPQCWTWSERPELVLRLRTEPGASAQRRIELTWNVADTDRRHLDELLTAGNDVLGDDVDVRPGTARPAEVAMVDTDAVANDAVDTDAADTDAADTDAVDTDAVDVDAVDTAAVDTDVVDSAAADVDVVDVGTAVRALGRRPLLAITGAGISAATGIRPFFGPSGVDRDLGLLEAFPGRAVELMIDDPVGTIAVLARWHLGFLHAEPSAAHRALADLERRGHLAGVWTTNIDRLHQAAGARRVAERHALGRVRPPASAGVVVTGSASDAGGVIARARAAGGQVVVVDVTTPAWTQPGDLVVHGDPQRLLPAIAASLPGLRTPLTVLGEGPSADRLLDEVASSDPPSVDGPPWGAVPQLADRVRRGSAARRSQLHGPRHWLTVAWIGAALAARDEQVDPLVAVLFGLFHDCARISDGHDPDHGQRGAEVAARLLGGADWLADDQLDRLLDACRRHTAGQRSDDPTVGACWDADRLDLWRVGATPSPRFLSRPAAADLAAWSRRFGEVADDDAAWDDWRQIAAFGAALAERR